MELEDQPWFPSFLRDQQTAFIGFVVNAFGIYKPLVPQLKSLLEPNYTKTWTDCCSGAAGPILFLQKQVNFSGEILLTDKFPNKNIVEAKISKIEYWAFPSDILKDKIPNTGLVTMFNAFHHFNNTERRIIIGRLISQNRPFLIAEVLQPTILDMVKIFVTATLGQLLLAPFVQPFSLKRLLFTYLIPLNIITVFWDGIVSVTRAVPFSAMQQLAESYNSKTFQIEAIQHQTPLAVITYLVGKPVVMDN